MSDPLECDGCLNKKYAKYNEMYYCEITQQPIFHAIESLKNNDGSCSKKQMIYATLHRWLKR